MQKIRKPTNLRVERAASIFQEKKQVSCCFCQHLSISLLEYSANTLAITVNWQCKLEEKMSMLLCYKRFFFIFFQI